MKIIECLKQMKMNEKKLGKNVLMIQQYSSVCSAEKPVFGTEDIQRKEVKELIQSNMDLIKRQTELRSALQKTNMETEVNIGDITDTIDYFLYMKTKGIAFTISTYNALNERTARQRMMGGNTTVDGKRPQVEYMYDEKEKNAALRKYGDLEGEISARLEVINATTNIIGLDAIEE